MDKMVLKKPIRVDTDLRITGAVTWVGRSSIDIQIEVTQLDEGADHHRITCTYLLNNWFLFPKENDVFIFEHLYIVGLLQYVACQITLKHQIL